MKEKPQEKIIRLINRACVNKTGLSKEAADRIVDFNAKTGRLLYYYKCIYCSSYHITKNEPYNVNNGIEVV